MNLYFIHNTPAPFFIKLCTHIHICAGLFSLLIFPLPLISKKGSRTHQLFGYSYVCSMLIVNFTTLIITLWRYFFDHTHTELTRLNAITFFFVSVFISTVLYQGIYAIKVQNKNLVRNRIITNFIPFIILSLSFILFFIGIYKYQWQLILFTLIASTSSVSQIKFWKKSTISQSEIIKFHFENMFTSGIFTVASFVITGLPKFIHIPEEFKIYTWVVPLAIMIPSAHLYSFWFRRKNII